MTDAKRAESDPIARRLAIIGVGLMGGSFARALREAGGVGEVVAFDLDAAQSRRAVELGVADFAVDSVAATVAGADYVLLATPVSAMESVLREVLPALGRDAVLTDVGSTKRSVIAAAQSAGGGVPARFVPAHPIAGGERFGVEAADAGLFSGRRVILTPHPGMDTAAAARVRAAWQACGATVTEMAAEHHDEVLAATSHLPHVLAYALVDCLAGMEAQREIFAYAAGGFRDFTRIASSSPRMWHDIVRCNRDALLPVIDAFAVQLHSLREAIERDDGDAILACFTRARAARERYLELVEKPVAGEGT